MIDSIYFQRLHFVLQNSTAYSTYPNNKHSRFEHSLGVSHLAGRIFVHALKNSNRDTLTAFLEQAYSFIRLHLRHRHDSLEKCTRDWDRLIGNASRFYHDPHDVRERIDFNNPPTGSALPASPLFIINTLWIAIRLSGLVHDIGHLPMSHLFERALSDADQLFRRYHGQTHPASERIRALGNHTKPQPSDIFALGTSPELVNAEVRFITQEILACTEADFNHYVTNELELHERRSLRALDLLHRMRTVLGAEFQEYRDLIYLIAKSILFSFIRGTSLLGDSGPMLSSGFLYCMRDIIASDIDADRLDYVARDPISSGTELGAFDVNRIVESFTLARMESGRFVICPSLRALSAIETFFHQRYLLYRYLVYHRAVLRSNLLLEEVIKHLIYAVYMHPRSTVAELLATFGFGGEEPHDERSISHLLSGEHGWEIDDAWLRTIVISVHRALAGGEGAVGGWEQTLSMLCETFLFRKTENVWTPWKSQAECVREFRSVGWGGTTHPLALGVSEDVSRFQNLVERYNCQWASDGMILLARYLKPKTHLRKSSQATQAAALSVYDPGTRTLEPLEELSPYVASLGSVAEETINVFLGYCAKGIKENGEPTQAARSRHAEVLEALVGEFGIVDRTGEV